jgi:hypothetical protein
MFPLCMFRGQSFCSSHTLSQPAASATQPSLLLLVDCNPKMAFECAYCLKTYKTKRGLSNHQSRTDCIEFHNAILRREEEQSARIIQPRREEEQTRVVEVVDYTTCEQGIDVEPVDEFPSSGQPSSPQEEAEPRHPTRATRPRRVKRTIHFDSFPPPPPPTELEEPNLDPPDDQAAASNELVPADDEVAIEEESDLDLGRPSTRNHSFRGPPRSGYGLFVQTVRRCWRSQIPL